MAKNSDNSGRPAVDAAERVKDSAQQIWLAGLGAFAKAQQEGSKVFESLVADGLNLQRKTQASAQAQMAEASQKFSAMTGGLSSKAGQQWDRLEGIFEERVAKALERLNMASRADLEEMQQRIDALEAQLRKLGQAAPVKRSPRRSSDRPSARPGDKAAAPSPSKSRLRRGESAD